MSVVMVMAMRVAMNIVIVQVIAAFDVPSARHYEDMAIGPHDLDFGAIESREHRCFNHLVNGSEHRLAIAEVKYAIESPEQLIELVGAEEHSDPAPAADLPDDVDHDFLMARVEANQGLVEQQQLRLADQRLGEQQTLALAA